MALRKRTGRVASPLSAVLDSQSAERERQRQPRGLPRWQEGKGPQIYALIKMRSDLMIAIKEAVAGWGLIQAGAAKRLAITQLRLNDLLRGSIGKFSLDALVELASRAGLALRIEITRPVA